MQKSGTLFADPCRFAKNKNVAANGSTFTYLRAAGALPASDW